MVIANQQKAIPCVTKELKQLMLNRDYLKKQAISFKDPEKWYQYTNVQKRLYFTKNFD